MKRLAAAFLLGLGAWPLAALGGAADAPPPPVLSMPLDDAAAPPPPPINFDEPGAAPEAPTPPPNLESPPSEAPTEAPTPPPTEVPTERPSKVPTQAPTAPPTRTPTRTPTQKATAAPTLAPATATSSPTQEPSPEPTALPSPEPTQAAPAFESADEGIPAGSLPPPEEAVPGQGLDVSQIGAYNVAPPSWMFTPEPTPQPQAEVAESDVRWSDEQPRLKLKGKKDKFGDKLDAELKKLPKAERERYFGVAMLVTHARELEDQGRLYEAWRAYRDALAKNPGHKLALKGARGFYVRRFFDHARELAKAKRYFEAANLYGDVINADPGHSGAWYGLGVIFYKYDKKAQALKCFDEVLKLRPDLKEFSLWVEKYRL